MAAGVSRQLSTWAVADYQRASPLANWPRSKNVFGYGPAPQILKEPKSLYHSPSGTSGHLSIQRRSWFRSATLIARSRIRSINAAVLVRANSPIARFSALAEDHSAQFISQAVCCFRILLVAETLGQSKKLPSFLRLRSDPVLDEFQQHAILAKLATPRHANYLLCKPRRQTHTLANRFISCAHAIIMHQSGAVSRRGRR
jgi:hypothetical protein